MGVFATITALETKMVGIDFDTVTSALADACITDAESEVKKYLSKGYDLTTNYFNVFASVPPLVRSLTETLAVGYMYENMSRGSKEGLARSDRLIERATQNLTLLQEGTLQLYDTTGALVPTNGKQWQVQCNTSDYSNTFNEDKPKNWRPDRDKLDDISDERDE
jgi:hypothetical protein